MFGERKSYSGLNPRDSRKELWITYKRRKCANPSSDSAHVSKISGGVRNAQELLITYKRKRCANPRPNSRGVAAYSLIRRRCRDIGWEHGTMVDGNSNHWQCNWCGLIGYGGGANRLKRHLVKCRSTPHDVSEAIKNYMMMKREIKSRRSAASDGTNNVKLRCSDYVFVGKDGPLVDSTNEVGNHGQLFEKASEPSRIYPYQSKSSVHQPQVAVCSLFKKRCRDIGEEHGTMIDGKRWKCNWCGLVRHGEGLFRIKRHLLVCCNVPDDVCKAVEDYIIMKTEKRRLRRFSSSDGKNKVKSSCSDHMFVDKEGPLVNPKEVGSHCQLLGKTSEQSRIHPYQSKSSMQQPQATTHLSDSSVAKGSAEEHHGTVLQTNTSKQDCHASKDSHWTCWKYVLENMLQLPDVRESGGVRSCICDALTMGHSGLTERLEMSDISRNTEQPQDRFEGYEKYTTAASGISKPTSFDSTKCQNYLVDILCSENFALLCDLLWRTFADNKTKGFFDFSIINAKMKNGDYGRGPGLIDQDIQQVWAKVKEVGRNMIHLAECLSNMSSASSQKQAAKVSKLSVDEHKTEKNRAIVVEQKNSVKSNTCNLDLSAKVNQTEPSSLHKTAIVAEQKNSVKSNTRNLDHSAKVNQTEPSSLHKTAIVVEQKKPSPPGFTNTCNLDHSAKVNQTEPSSLHKTAIVVEQKNSVKSNTCNLDNSAKVNQTEPSSLHKTAIVVEQKNSVKSNTCNLDHSAKVNQTEPSSLHKTSASQQCGTKANSKESRFSCPNSTTKLKPIQNSYVPDRTNEREHPEPTSVTYVRKDSLNQSCAANDKLEDDSHANNSRVSSVSNIELDEVRTSISRLCKLCGTCEEKNRRFLVCSHVDCPYKFYHRRCLNSRQRASTVQQNNPCWLCPSCLCRACLLDKDDDKILLCDGCERAYHTYCVNLPPDLVPTGEWYCVRCNVLRERGVLRNERGIFERHRISEHIGGGNESTCLVDLLLSAAEKLKFEENMRDTYKSKKGHHCTHFVKP